MTVSTYLQIKAYHASVPTPLQEKLMAVRYDKERLLVL